MRASELGEYLQELIAVYRDFDIILITTHTDPDYAVTNP